MKTKKTLSFRDQINALRRSEKYRRDYEDYQKYCRDNEIEDGYLHDWLCPTPLSNLSKGAQDLCKKYGFPFPVDPEGTVTSLPEGIVFSIEDHIDQLAVRPLPLKKGTTVFGLEDGQHLNVSIDMARTEDEITQEIKRLHKHYNPKVKGSLRQRVTTQDPWFIYDQVEKEGKNFSMIAKELSGIDANPTYDERIDAVRKQVANAYNKAKRMILAVED